MQSKAFSKASFLVPVTILTLVLTTASIPVFANPTDNPPSATIQAVFSALTSGTLNINAQGVLSNTGNSPVVINEDQGLSVGTSAGSLNFNVTGNGVLSNPGTQNSGRMRIADTDGFEVATSAGTVGTTFGSGGDITSNGHIKAMNGIGSFSTYIVSSTIAPSSSSNVVAACPAGMASISCGYSSVAPYGTFQVNSAYISNVGCTVSTRNTSAVSQTMHARIVCFDPNS